MLSILISSPESDPIEARELLEPMLDMLLSELTLLALLADDRSDSTVSRWWP
jgi:hypothetical protein